MILRTDSPYIGAMIDNDREYGLEDYDTDEEEEVREECPYCLAEKPKHYFRSKDGFCLGCSECVTQVTTIRGLHI